MQYRTSFINPLVKCSLDKIHLQSYISGHKATFFMRTNQLRKSNFGEERNERADISCTVLFNNQFPNFKR